MKILLISRGNGFGHAKRDLLITKQLIKLNHEVTIASYSSGYLYLQMMYTGSLIDLGLPAKGSNAIRLQKLLELINSYRPDGIVVDEELLVLPIARSMKIPTCFITNWLEDEQETLSFLQMADRIALVDVKENWMFPIPNSIQNKIRFVGPILDIPKPTQIKEKKVIITSGSPTIADVNFFRQSILALKYEHSYSKLVYSGTLTKSLKRFENDTTRFIADPTSFMEEVRSSSLVICRGGHTTLWELAALNIPTIAIPHSEAVNPYNVLYAKQMEARGYVKWLDESAIDVEFTSYVSRFLLDVIRLSSYCYDSNSVIVLVDYILKGFSNELKENISCT